MASVQDNMLKSVPERQSTLGFAAPKDDRRSGGGGGGKWNSKMCKFPVKSHHSLTHQFSVFTGQTPFLSPDQQCQSTKGIASSSYNQQKFTKAPHQIKIK